MGINQDAYDYWEALKSNEPDEEKYLGYRHEFLQKLSKVNAKFGMPVPTKKDLHNGFLREYHELNPTTQVAIKEMIFGMSAGGVLLNTKYRQAIEKSIA